MGNSASQLPSQEHAPSDLLLPLGILTEFTTHSHPLVLQLLIESTGWFHRSIVETLVQDYVTQEEVFSIFPAKGGIQTLYSSAKVPLLSVQRHGKTLAQDEYTGADPETGEELFHAKNSSKFKVDFKVSFKNRARATKQEIYDAEITFRCDLVSSTMRRDGIVNKAQQHTETAVITFGETQIGDVAWVWGIKDTPSRYKLTVNPG